MQVKTYRPINTIAKEISNDWAGKVNYAAKPYLDAMHTLMFMNEKYVADSAHDIIARFLSNASSWRGEVAKRIKKELNEMLKG